MFCPTGPAATVTAGTVTLVFGTGLDVNNRVLKVFTNKVGQTELSFNGPSGTLVDFFVYDDAEFRIPAVATSVTVSATGGGSGTAQASAVAGLDV